MDHATLSIVAVFLGVVCILIALVALDWRLGLAGLGALLIAAGYLVDVPDGEGP